MHGGCRQIGIRPPKGRRDELRDPFGCGLSLDADECAQFTILLPWHALAAWFASHPLKAAPLLLFGIQYFTHRRAALYSYHDTRLP